jgi:SAM-dependent methyltransferase
MNLTKKYWKNINPKNYGAAPNVSLFRFLGEYGFDFKNKKVLEVGFFHGADLMEFKKRKSAVYGLDINKKAVEILKKKILQSHVKQSDCGKEKIPFSLKFDLIYSRDFMYYLDENEMLFHFKDAYRSLKKGGLFLFQFLEKDLILKKKTKKRYNFEKNYVSKKFAEKKNNVKYYNENFFKQFIVKSKFKNIGKKFLIESYGTKEKKIRINKYLLCIK